MGERQVKAKRKSVDKVLWAVMPADLIAEVREQLGWRSDWEVGPYMVGLYTSRARAREVARTFAAGRYAPRARYVVRRVTVGR